MAVAVLDDGKVVLDAAFGDADREEQRKAQTNTLFRWGSISKPLAATITMQLVDEKVLDLDADVRERVPAMKERYPLVTLRQLLSHTGGVRHYLPLKPDNSTRHLSTTQALELFVHDELVAPPGTKHSYSTHGYTLVAAALEQATQKTYVELVRARIRDRGLPSLDCEVLADAKKERSALYDLAKGAESARRSAPPQDNSWKYAGGGLESTALDLARFGELVRTAKLVSEAGRDAMWTRAKLQDGSEVAYGLGWNVSKDRAEMAHTGSQQGAQSALLVVPGEGLVIAVLTNTNGTRPREVVERVRKVLAASAAGAAK